jgi:hypothetical protein
VIVEARGPPGNVHPGCGDAHYIFFEKNFEHLPRRIDCAIFTDNVSDAKKAAFEFT